MIARSSILQIDFSHDRQFPPRETSLKMKVRAPFLGALLLAAALVLPAFSEILQQTENGGQAQSPAPGGTQTTTLPAQSQASP